MAPSVLPFGMQDVKKDTSPDWSEQFQILCDSPPRDELLFIRVWHHNRGKDKLLRAMTNIKHLMKANIEGKVRGPRHHRPCGQPGESRNCLLRRFYLADNGRAWPLATNSVCHLGWRIHAFGGASERSLPLLVAWGYQFTDALSQQRKREGLFWLLERKLMDLQVWFCLRDIGCKFLVL